MDLAPSGRVYKTTPAQRAKAAAWRKANPEKSLAYARAQTIRIRDSFIGPKRPRGRQRIEGLTKAQQVAQDRKDRREAQDRQRALAALVKSLRRVEALRRRAEHAGPPTPADRSEAARRGHQTRAAAFVGPPKPAPIATAQRLAKVAEWNRTKRANFKAAFVGPPTPPGFTRTTRTPAERSEVARKGRRTRALAFVGPPRSEDLVKTRKLARHRDAWTAFQTSFVGPRRPLGRPVSKVVLRPPKAPPKPRSTLALPRPRIDPPAIFGPPAPPRAVLRDTMRQEVAQAKAQAAADKVGAKELAVAARIAARAEAKAIEKAMKTWDRESIKLMRKTARFIREQVREAAQIAAKSRTPEQIAASKAAYEAVMASWDAEQRRIADETRNAFRRRVDAEAERALVVAQDAKALLSSTPGGVMRSPVRRVPFIR